ncbi:hypothetical protein EG68_07823 [Paragonimus skrjabini miyazakii]|uniref:Transmembrane protein 39A n=1 Tax=Paragonimus skrjabini miyazakii TaxID=59628 RepID=A0A8S9YRF1_9TREM|nr:hypothetical protein EG68_07823 [Paragonimus skrjabini miyazakii]
MPIGRRAPGRPPASPNATSTGTTLKSADHPAAVTSTQSCVIIKHVTFPAFPNFSLTLFSCFLIVLSTVAIIIQYLNVYKTVWWIPNTLSPYGIDFDLIDPYLLIHCLLMLLIPRLYVMMVGSFVRSLVPGPVVRSLLGISLFGFWIFSLLHTASRIDFNNLTLAHSVISGLVLLYFPVISLVLYHHEQLLSILKAIRTRFSRVHSRRSKQTASSAQIAINIVNASQNCLSKLKHCVNKIISVTADWPTSSPTSALFPVRYVTVSTNESSLGAFPHFFQTAYYTVDPQTKSLLLLRHQCLTNSAEQIREEVNLYRRDFNTRLYDVLYGPDCCLTVRIHSLYTGGCTDLANKLGLRLVLVCATYPHNCFTFGRLEIVRAARRTCAVECMVATTVYPEATHVRHIRGQFCSSGSHTAAEPGNTSHSRFHLLFCAPLRPISVLFFVALGVPVYQLYSLRWVFEWYKLIGLSATGLLGLFNLYFHSRQFMLVLRVYESETPRVIEPDKATDDARATSTPMTKTWAGSAPDSFGSDRNG